MKYAIGDNVEATAGYTVTISAPVVDATAEAYTEDDAVYADFSIDASVDASEVDFNQDFLITIEVNGVVIAWRELHAFDFDADFCATIGGIGFTDVGSDGIVLGNVDSDDPVLADDDEVRLIVEPVKVVLSDAFRAAVRKSYVPGAVEVTTEQENVLEPNTDVPNIDFGGGGGLIPSNPGA